MLTLAQNDVLTQGIRVICQPLFRHKNCCIQYNTPLMNRTLLFLILFPAIAFVLYGCHKSSGSKPTTTTIPDTYTTHIGGTRNWHGHHHYDATGVHFPTPIYEDYDLHDTSFAVTVLNDTTIQCMGITFTHMSTDSAKQVHYFGTAYFFYEYGSGNGVAYFYSRDSITYCYGDVHGTSDSWTKRDIYHTY